MRSKAVIDLISDESLNELAVKLTAKHADDLIQEVALLLLEMPEDKWHEINEGGYLRWYVIRTMMNMGTSPRSTFATKYGLFDRDTPLPTVVDEDFYDYEKEADIQLIENLLEDYHWYDADIVKLWIEHGSYRKVAALTSIPFKSIGNTVRKTLNNLKNDYIDHHIKRAIGGSTFTDIRRNSND